jgi:hypothetical protein
MKRYDYLMPAIIAAQASDSLAFNVSPKLVNQPIIDSTDTAKGESQVDDFAGVLTFEGRI